MDKYFENGICAIKNGENIGFFASGIKIGNSDATEQYSKIEIDREAVCRTKFRRMSIEIGLICRRLKNKFFKSQGKSK